MSDKEKARRPEDLTRLFVERANEGDAAGIAALYEEDAVMAYPPGSQTIGRAAIQALWEKVLANAPRFEQEPLTLAADLEGFLSQLSGNANSAQIVDRQRVLRLLVKNVLIGPEKITIRHRIPLRQRASDHNAPTASTDTEGDRKTSCQVRWGRNCTGSDSPSETSEVSDRRPPTGEGFSHWIPPIPESISLISRVR